MKIFILLLLPLISTNTATSQINKHQFLLGGNISFESVKNDGDGVYTTSYNTTTFFVSPNIGYFIIPKFAGGLRLDVSIYNQNTAVSNQSNISLSPFLRYYFLSQRQRFNILADVGYVNSKSKTRIQSLTVTETRNGFTISAGPSIFLNQHVGLEFLLGYKYTKLKNISDNETTAFNTVLGLQIHLERIKTKTKSDNGH
jgi:hypothetical protein